MLVTDDTFERIVLRSPIPVLVDFYADWCGPCRSASPAVEALGQEFSGRLTVVKMDTDGNPSIPSTYGVRSLPTFIVFRDGQPVSSMIGYRGEADLRKKIEEALS